MVGASANDDPNVMGLIPRLFKRAKEASWVTKYFVWLVIVFISLKAASNYLNQPTEVDHYLDRLFVFCGFTILLIGSLLREFLLSRQGRYANITPRIEDISSAIRDLNTCLASMPEDNVNLPQAKKTIISEIQLILDDIRELFSVVSGTSCRVAIKCVLSESGKIYVYALARDRSSSEVNQERDKERFQRRADSLEGNEDFSMIFNKEVRYYLDNDLATRMDYQNSSLDLYGRRRQTPALVRWLWPSWGWNLPYRSTIVFPIEQPESTRLALEPKGCIGFLAVDSPNKNAFSRSIDGPLGAAIANALFAPLIRYVNLVGPPENQERQA